MKITIIAVGKVKSNNYLNDIKNYLKQINYPISIIEVNDEPKITGIKKEALNILKKIPPQSYLISLDSQGKSFDSLEFSKHLEKLIETQKRGIVFIIGGSFGLDQLILEKSDESLSLSKLTFPHRMARLILVEQIYRAFKIMAKHPYHK
ncbi:MAG: 23S rRNA (pseudouridine(1915)-N(3))-methyltransferase RlmH [Acholeplasmataceae bacterium]|nr:23S rRNA (pseudouridine(1915)-N(3))-methyltransferase RlmH [Acholeplasmataceae bacterium]